jgi:hypothetical protein
MKGSLSQVLWVNYKPYKLLRTLSNSPIQRLYSLLGFHGSEEDGVVSCPHELVARPAVRALQEPHFPVPLCQLWLRNNSTPGLLNLLLLGLGLQAKTAVLYNVSHFLPAELHALIIARIAVVVTVRGPVIQQRSQIDPHASWLQYVEDSLDVVDHNRGRVYKETGQYSVERLLR